MDETTVLEGLKRFFLHPIVVLVSVILLGVVIYGFYDGLRRRKPFIGRENLVGRVGEAMTDIHPTGLVLVEGENWRARTIAEHIRKGEEIVVVRADGMTLLIKRKETTPHA